MHQQTKTIEIRATANKCFQVICDFGNYGKWQKNVKQITVLEQERGRPLMVEYQLDAMLKTITYTLRYSYQDQDQKKLGLSWDYVGGDLKKIEGSYVFEERAPDKTHVTFALNVDIGQWVPAFIMQTFKEGSMKETLDALKRRVEVGA